MHKLHFICPLVWPETWETSEKKCLMSAAGNNLFSCSSHGLSMSSMSIIELSARMSGDSWPEDWDIFAFLVAGVEIGPLLEVVGERTITLFRDSKLLIASEHCLIEVKMDWTCSESVVTSSVSVGGRGEDSGRGDEGLSGSAASAAVTEATALWCAVSSSSPAFSAVSLVVRINLSRRASWHCTDWWAGEGLKKQLCYI